MISREKIVKKNKKKTDVEEKLNSVSLEYFDDI